MVTQGAKKRKAIFEVYSKNFELTKKFLTDTSKIPKVDKLYVCPICLRAYDEGGLVQTYSDSLTLEDIPPKKLGGKPLILTCKVCNNASGGKLDLKLSKQRNVNSFLVGDENSSVNAQITLGENFKTAATLTVNHQNNLFRFQINSDQTSRVSEYITKASKENALEGHNINFSFQEPSRRISMIAQLRIAYLFAFFKFGYGFALNNSYQAIRDQIQYPEKEILSSFGVLDPVGVEHEGVLLVTEPKWLKSFLIVYRLRLQNKVERRGVLIPGPGDDAAKFYKGIKDLKSTTHLKYKTINTDIGKINEANDPALPIRIWREFNKDTQ